VVSAVDGIAGTLFGKDRHDQLSDSLVDHRLGAVRGRHRIADEATLLASIERMSSTAGAPAVVTAGAPPNKAKKMSGKLQTPFGIC
jgi:hypothetical protein